MFIEWFKRNHLKNHTERVQLVLNTCYQSDFGRANCTDSCNYLPKLFFLLNYRSKVALRSPNAFQFITDFRNQTCQLGFQAPSLLWEFPVRVNFTDCATYFNLRHKAQFDGLVPKINSFFCVAWVVKFIASMPTLVCVFFAIRNK